jgi:dienelactone hydrolase
VLLASTVKEVPGGGTLEIEWAKRINDLTERHVAAVIPHNLKTECNSRLFGLIYSQKQNSRNLGFINGTVQNYFMKDVLRVVENLLRDMHEGYARIVNMGFSAGGFGVLHFAGVGSLRLDVALIGAGHAHGTIVLEL